MARSDSTAIRPLSQAAPRLAVLDIRVSRGGRRVLQDLTFEVGSGEVFGLLGPNGAGKTTAFHVLTGLLEPEAGRVLLDGTEVRPRDPAFRAQVGCVFQGRAPVPRLTAGENLSLAARLYDVPRDVARGRIDELLERAELRDRADEPIARFSGGMRRRIELARALVHEPKILVLDEPTAGLDEGAFRRTWAHLLFLRRERGITLLLTTHRPEEAEYCDRLAIIDRGRIIACDAPDRLRARVSGDVIVLEAEEPQAVAALVSERFAIAARVLDGKVVLERPRGHELVPRLVEACPEGMLRSVSIRRPGLGEVFLELTGHELVERDGARENTP